MKYEFDITYTDFDGYKTMCGVSGCDSPEQAKIEAIELAKSDGWTNPKWWQWWRLGDTRVDV